MHKVLVNCLFKLAQEKVWLADKTIAVYWDVKQQTNLLTNLNGGADQTAMMCKLVCSLAVCRQQSKFSDRGPNKTGLTSLYCLHCSTQTNYFCFLFLQVLMWKQWSIKMLN